MLLQILWQTVYLMWCGAFSDTMDKIISPNYPCSAKAAAESSVIEAPPSPLTVLLTNSQSITSVCEELPSGEDLRQQDPPSSRRSAATFTQFHKYSTHMCQTNPATLSHSATWQKIMPSEARLNWANANVTSHFKQSSGSTEQTAAYMRDNWVAFTWRGMKGMYK